jgi:hypothetical protein
MMSGISFEDFVGGGAPTAAPSRRGSGFPSVSQEEQQERDRLARRLQENETRTAQGEPSQFPETRSVVEGAKAPGVAPVGMSFEEFTGAPGKTAPGASSRLVDQTLMRLKNMGGEAAALADLVLSLPGFILQTGASLGGTAIAGGQALLTGGERGVPFTPNKAGYSAYTAGREIGQEIAAPFMNPLYKLMQFFKSGEVYEGALTSRAMEKFGHLMEDAGRWAEEATGGRVPRDSIPMLVETLMVASPGPFAKGKPAIEPHIQKAIRDSADRLRAEAEVELEAAAPPSAEVQAAARPIQKQINELLGIKTPQERAAEIKAKRRDVKAAFERPAEGSDYVDIAESQFRAGERAQRAREFEGIPLEERVGGTVYEAGKPPEPGAVPYEVGSHKPVERLSPGEAFRDAVRILSVPGHQRTALDIARLRRIREAGAASPELTGLLATAGIGAAAGALLDDEALRGAVLGGATGLAAAAPFVRKGALPEGKKLSELGAVKGPGGEWKPEAVERLATPLFEGTTRVTDMAELSLYARDPQAWEAADSGGRRRSGPLEYKSIANWALEKSKRYLERYAGTARDPLKDIKIPVHRYDIVPDEWVPDMARWEQVMDEAIQERASSTKPGTKAYLLGGEERAILEPRLSFPRWRLSPTERAEREAFKLRLCPRRQRN